MRRIAPLGLALLCSCSSPAPARRPAESTPPEPASSVSLPERIVLPAAYRLVLLDGHLTLVREADATSLGAAPASLRIIAGEISKGELAYQPGLLPQELAGEVAAYRERSSRMDAALESVMRRSRELSDEALRIQAEASRLAELVSSERARAGSSHPARPVNEDAPSQATSETQPTNEAIPNALPQ